MAKGCGIDGLDLASQTGQRSSSEQTQDIGIAPLTFRTAWPELPAEQRAGGEQPLERVIDDADRQTPARGGLRSEERPVGPCVSCQQPVECRCGWGEERLGHTHRCRHADAIAVSRDVLDGDPALVPGDPDRDGSPARPQLVEPRRRRLGTTDDPRPDLVGREVAEAP